MRFPGDARDWLQVSEQPWPRSPAGMQPVCKQSQSDWWRFFTASLIITDRSSATIFWFCSYIEAKLLRVSGLWASGVWLETVDVSFCGCRRQQICFLFIQSHTDDWESYSCFMDVLKHQTASTTTGSNVCWLLSPAAIPSCPALNHSSYFENDERRVYEKKKKGKFINLNIYRKFSGQLSFWHTIS